MPGAPAQLAIYAQTASLVSLTWAVPTATGNLTVTDYYVEYQTVDGTPTAYFTGNRTRAWVRGRPRGRGGSRR